MSRLDEIIKRMPKGTTVSISTIGRHLGNVYKYEAKYVTRGQLPYIYTADTPEEAVEKLWHKLESPDCHIVRCYCHYNCQCCEDKS